MKVEGNDRAFAAWEDLRRRVEALENSIPLNSRVDPPGCPACNGVAGTACRCAEPVTECCTDGTCPTCAPLMAWTDYRKDYQPRDTVTASKAFFAGWEASREYHRDTPEPTSDMLYDAWCIIANAPVRGWAFFGTPEPEAEEWIDAAKRWRDAFHDLNSAPEPDPEPVPEWREWVTAQHDEVVGSRASALEDVLMCLSEVERGASKNYALARIVARCEREIGDGWQADPDRVRFKCGIQGLIDALPVWTTLGNRAASWLRDLTDGGSDE
jgi:hypothetical protein